jgi:hypothetical protein
VSDSASPKPDLKVLPFKAGQTKQVIQVLETMLEKARAGEITSVIVCCERADRTGHFEAGFGDAPNFAALVGELEFVKHAICSSVAVTRSG